mmetsp:Transcript_59206/g.165328  ORF Transcript_59206/g.165328 Transcript_59206/m.165328 type:complete len:290 (-) Transcript_59206:272-1141(-)
MRGLLGLPTNVVVLLLRAKRHRLEQIPTPPLHLLPRGIERRLVRLAVRARWRLGVETIRPQTWDWRLFLLQERHIHVFLHEDKRAIVLLAASVAQKILGQLNVSGRLAGPAGWHRTEAACDQARATMPRVTIQPLDVLRHGGVILEGGLFPAGGRLRRPGGRMWQGGLLSHLPELLANVFGVAWSTLLLLCCIFRDVDRIRIQVPSKVAEIADRILARAPRLLGLESRDPQRMPHLRVADDERVFHEIRRSTLAEAGRIRRCLVRPGHRALGKVQIVHHVRSFKGCALR